MSRRNSSVIIGILALALLLRASGVRWGLPYLFHPDEFQVVDVYLRMVKNLDLNPHWFTYPSLMMYVNAFVYGIYFIIRHLLGGFHRADIPFPDVIVLGAGKIADPNVFYLGRAVSILFGMGVVVLAYYCARKVQGSNAVGWLAALFTAISSVNIVQSRLILPNIYVAFFVMATLWFSLKIFETGQGRYYVLAGLAAGFTAASKYNGVLVFIIPLMAHFLKYGFDYKKLPNLLMGQLMIAVGFIIAVPFSLLDYQNFLPMMIKTRNEYALGWAGQEGGVLVWYLRYLFEYEGLVPLAALGAILVGVLRKDKGILIAGSFPVLYFLFINTFSIRNDKTILPILPVIHVLGAVFLAMVLDFVKSRIKNPFFARWIFVPVVGLCLLIPLTKTIPAVADVYKVDGRTTSRIWIEENIPAGSVIALENYSPYLDRQKFKIIPIYSFEPYPLSWYYERKVDYLVFSAGMYGRYYRDPALYQKVIDQYEQLFAQLEPVKFFHDGGYEIRIYRLPKK